jgi:small nuclear ribonucleoprotein (snRNP)-like protein
MSIHFHPFFKKLAERNLPAEVEMKNGVTVTGTLHFVDSNLNFHLTETSSPTPQLAGVSRVYMRGNGVKFVKMRFSDVSLEFLEALIERERIS